MAGLRHTGARKGSAMHANTRTITKFYPAFDDAVFTQQGQAQALCIRHMPKDPTRGKRMDAGRLEFSDVEAAATTGPARWDAHYRFSPPRVRLGGSPFLRGTVRQQAAGNLQRPMAGRKTP